MEKSSHVKEVYKLLRKSYPKAVTFLNYNSPFQLLVAVVLSAQTTDAQVNKITPVLFEKYPDPEALMAAEIPDVEQIIRSTGFYKVKTRNITGAAKKLVSDYNSEVPQQMEDLLTLPGVGRKSANVIRAHCFNKPSIIVDTHFSRVTKRIGFTSSSNPEVIERD
ncbi:MAG: endonuclease III, partial [Spirochaetota bacterium]|nr:endonuclease III [Spirochaetota bacterium]